MWMGRWQRWLLNVYGMHFIRNQEMFNDLLIQIR
jgi:hypothetical protein